MSSCREKRPPGLKGREIGMYYRNLMLKRRREQGDEKRIILGPSVNVPPGILARVDECLHNAAQNNDDEKVCDEFERNFHNLLKLDFEAFIAEDKEYHIEAVPNDSLNIRYKNELLSRKSTTMFRQIFEERQKLPVMKQNERLLKAYEDHQIMLIIGSTGCGKTTQVPQIILDNNIYGDRGACCNIVCTQPRRISAITVAERVAYERCEKLGTSVGYQIRLESEIPREQGSILYCTTGVLLQKMRSNPLLHGTNVVILDEIHERSVETDLKKKKILVFLPGFDVISKLHAILQKPSSSLGQRVCQKIKIYTLHSMMPSIYQRSVFDPAPNGMRKVILSTVIAETSVTIDDVVYVINTGRTKTQSYDVSANLQTLELTWVTKANSKQRKGRAGRVQPGICYNLFTRAREELMDEKPTPQILCSKLESIILGLKFLRIKDVSEFLGTLLSPPTPTAIDHGITLLKRIEALDSEGVITPLGMHLASLPIEPQMGKMLLMAGLFRCLNPITSVAAGLSFKSPFFIPLGQEKKADNAKRHLADGIKSDHLLTHKVLERYKHFQQHHSERDFCYKNFLSINTLQQLEKMKQQFTDLLKFAKFIETSNYMDPSVNVDSKNVPLLRAIITAGLYPNMAKMKKLRQIKNRVFAIHHMSTPEDRKVAFHPSSVNAGECSFDSHYFVYFQKQKSSAVYLLDATMVYPMALIIFGDRVELGLTPDQQHYISVGQEYYFKCDPESAKLFLKLRSQLDLLMRKKALYPAPIAPGCNESYIISAIQLLLSMDEVEDYEVSSDNEDT